MLAPALKYCLHWSRLANLILQQFLAYGRKGLVLMLLITSANGWAGTSTCYGTVANGRLENAVQLPFSGKNFSAYSMAGAMLGRTYVHSDVADMVVATYRQLESTAPDKLFVYGETGREKGGRMRPHHTHSNGLSVDFMVPVLDAKGKSIPLPSEVSNKFGYGINFDEQGRYQDLQIDFNALAEHLYQLDLITRAKGRRLALVIFDISYLSKLFATPHGAYLKKNVSFMKTRPWIRHDQHYHVDFDIPCKKT